jgi:hypothetical protein
VSDLVHRAKVEVRRCQRNREAGGSAAFWERRLWGFQSELEEALRIVKEQRSAIEHLVPEQL